MFVVLLLLKERARSLMRKLDCEGNVLGKRCVLGAYTGMLSVDIMIWGLSQAYAKGGFEAAAFKF